MNLLSQNVGMDMIACVDADYDYLIQGATPVSHEILNNRYVFHTYAYAIENLQCYAPSLHDVTVAVTLNDHAIFDFEDYLSQYSEAIYPLSYGISGITVPHIMEISPLPISIKSSIWAILISMIHTTPYPIFATKWVDELNSFSVRIPNARESCAQVKRELSELGVTPQTTYLYIQGHHLFDKCRGSDAQQSLRPTGTHERENEIYRQARHNTQMRNELSCYSHSLEDIVSMLKRISGYMNSEPVRKIKADIESLFHHEDETETQKPLDVSLKEFDCASNLQPHVWVAGTRMVRQPEDWSHYLHCR